MFESLKNKLSSLFSREEEKEVEVIEETVEKTKKSSKDKPKKSSKKKSVKKKAIKEEPPKNIVEQDIETEEEIPVEENIEKKPKKVEWLEETIEEKNEDTINYLAEKTEESMERKGIFSRFKDRISTTTISKKDFEELFEDLEMLLIENNVALEVIDKIKSDMEKKLVGFEVSKSALNQKIRSSLKESLQEILIEPFDLIEEIKKSESQPFIILFFGINGSGKTTTISKITDLLNKNEISCVLSASDTFRAASIEQLMKHGEKLGIKVIHQNYGSDPSAVSFDAIQYAKSKGIKVVLIDTAGRMHTKDNLLKEMEKLIRITQPNLKIFVAESITGNDATEQAKSFNDAFTIDGTILTKADVDEKGGTAISIGYITKKPILYLGTGQEYGNLERFQPEKVIESLGLD